jgi:hypothetical protein
MQGFPGYASFAEVSAGAYIFGLSTAGIFPPGDLLSPKCILHCGAAASLATTAQATSTTLTASLLGFHELTGTVASPHF